MGLRSRATAALNRIINDSEQAFGWDIVITDPDGNVGNLVGRSTDISMLIDPETQAVVSGRSASIAVMIADLTSEGLGMPVGIADGAVRPWVVDVDDIEGVPGKFKISQSNPDRALGIVVCFLEAYQ